MDFRSYEAAQPHFFPDIGKKRPDICPLWNSAKAGLTLIEVMLAVIILGIGAGVLMTATARCMAVATKSKYYSRAHRLMSRVEAENPITRGEMEDGTESGSFEDGFTWEREITESEDEGREGLYTIRTRISWSSRGKQSYEEVSRYVYIQPSELELDEARRNRQ